MQITEIYHSIQGESRFAGLPCLFVRTTGCNLRCVWCDTEYSFYGGQNKSLDEIVDTVQSYQCNLVEITGGEPLLQKETPELVHRLLRLGYETLVETSGERDISVIDERAVRIMDLKCPGSGESSKNRWENISCLTSNDEVKFVLKNRKDYEWSCNIIQKYDLEKKVYIIFSPVFGEIDLQNLASWILKDNLKVRFQLQLHKQIWRPEARGV